MLKQWMLFFGIFALFILAPVSKANADGSGYRILPWCPAQGPVYLTLNGNQAQGYVGLDVMTLTEVEGHFVGTFKNERVDLSIFRSGDVRGTIGGYPVAWMLGRFGRVIYGLQPCNFIPLENAATE